ncbi:MAG: hypothetical protein JSV58_02830 [Candidatus Bathyarchaeota archaeon]|nr:MAG: hypothetical protein JSV58_02830 [Candidatus Bathyarchaeota archaeon]
MEQEPLQVLIAIAKIAGWISAASLIAAVLLWIFDSLHLLILAITYEALFTLIVGVVQTLSSYVYKKDSIRYRWGFRTRWFDFAKFAKLKPRERQRYRQEGAITVAIALILLAVTIILQLHMLR